VFRQLLYPFANQKTGFANLITKNTVLAFSARLGCGDGEKIKPLFPF